ncbi:hypothetical protein EHI8A_031990 [Entamoeba histolytica HM-1:IMSS-B]|uniref:Uncharacterized protein n=4 Tax=Entamoeba histolytica TaxID=5759 RepID=C4M897_ENTH1|nr:hypothetical protein EHI_019100 [Entamoeba histolytica HM-1:IMSS]EAL47733.1 hypothetical protein EHI_019100 [Entamoeba histolytica HM-1:IMSS]EMH74710.1 hypothetical protein EHI8A_031990 [Entamoeba histolytica HM-1:IMSS-B]ENY60906.1 hypothetical protein EHI7A_021710 [Entamoeba histolytica HM-1:IMSS-A]GAT97804.1 hypothetical protein CL6EHI_019100 [Entamoeba histolytica]|eukprot:XP_653119.1 hypothetical protein EHI_019100 [Entamoeba histolytica HM-1:IMSS]
MNQDSLIVISEGNSIVCNVNVPDEFFVAGKSWIGIYVVNREKNEHYHKSQYVTSATSVIRFNTLTDGIYDVRYFKENYEKCFNARVSIGQLVIPKYTISDITSNEYKLHLTFNQEQLLPGDWFGLFKTSSMSQKHPIVQICVDPKKNEYDIDLLPLNLEPYYYCSENGILTTKQERFEIRYYRSGCTCRNERALHTGIWPSKFSMNLYSFVPSGICPLNEIKKGALLVNINNIKNDIKLIYCSNVEKFEIQIYNENELIYKNVYQPRSKEITISLGQTLITSSIEIRLVCSATNHILEKKEHNMN